MIVAATMYNMDETGLALGLCANQTVVGTTATKRTIVARPQNREWVSIVEYIAADGSVLDPLVIFKGLHVQQQWFIPGQTPDWTYTSSPNAYTSDDIGVRWLREIFLPQTSESLSPGQYRLLLLDGHGSHTTPDFMWECHQNKVIPYYLLPHASHILQPLDLTVFASLKQSYRAAVAYDSDLDDTAPVKKQRFLKYYQDVRPLAFSTSNILSGFATAGIWPWCPRKALSSPFIVTPVSDGDSVRPRTPEEARAHSIIQLTPTNRRELLQAMRTLSQDIAFPRVVRDLLAKTGRTLDRTHFELATTKRTAASYKRQLDEYKAKSKKKQAVNPNDAFINLKDIQTAYEGGPPRIVEPPATTVATIANQTTPEPALSHTEAFQQVAQLLRTISSSYTHLQ